MEGFLTVTQTAKEFGVTRQAVTKWIAENKIKYTQLPGGQYRIPISEIKKIKEVK